MSLFSRHSHTYRVILHIGSGTVRGACVKDTPGAQSEIVLIHRSDAPIRERVQAQTLETHTFEAADRVLKHIHTTLKEKIDRVDVIYGSPWFSARTKNVIIERSEEFTITRSFVDDITKKEIATLKKDIAPHEYVLEEKITRMRLNGYESNNPLGKKVKKCELILFVSFISKEFVEKTRRAVEHTVFPRHILFHSFPSVGHSVVARLWNTDPQFVYIDVGGEVTELIFSEHTALTETFSFPLGTNHLIRAIAKKRSVSYDLATSTLSLYGHGTADATTTKDVEKILAPLREEWLAYVDQVIHESGSDHHVVQKIYISADELSADFWSQTLSGHTHKVLVLTPDLFSSFVHAAPHVALDPLMMLASLFIDTSESFPHLQSLRG